MASWLPDWFSRRTAGCRAINLSARSVSALPGEILCQGDAPEGCGNGIKSKWWSAWRIRNLRPITNSNFAQSINCTIASRPTGMMRRGCRMRISSSIHREQLRISSGAGTRSVPPEFFPGKQRQTAAKYIFDRTVASSIPQNCSNQRKSVLPAVCANGRFNVGSRGPGACPMIITSLTIAPPDTDVDCMRGQRRQRRSAYRCLSSRFCGVAVATIVWAVRTSPSNSQDQTGHSSVATAENFSAWKLRRGKKANSRQCSERYR